MKAIERKLGVTDIQMPFSSQEHKVYEEKLFVSPFTVDSHRKNLLAKLNVNNTAMLIRFAVENKLI